MADDPAAANLEGGKNFRFLSNVSGEVCLIAFEVFLGDNTLASKDSKTLLEPSEETLEAAASAFLALACLLLK